MIPLGKTGDLEAPMDPFYYAENTNHSDMDVSPDGRFVTVIGLEMPQVAVMQIHADGSFSTVQLIDLPYDNWGPYRGRYTPDGRHFLVLADTEPFMMCFRVDPNTGALEESDALHPEDWLPGGGFLVGALAITPDSRFAVVPNHSTTENATTFMVFRIEEDGTLTRITQVRNDFPGWPSDMDFLPPYREPETAAGTGWMVYQ